MLPPTEWADAWISTCRLNKGAPKIGLGGFLVCLAVGNVRVAAMNPPTLMNGMILDMPLGAPPV